MDFQVKIEPHMHSTKYMSDIFISTSEFQHIIPVHVIINNNNNYPGIGKIAQVKIKLNQYFATIVSNNKLATRLVKYSL